MSDETLADDATTPDEAPNPNVIATRTTEVYAPLEPLPDEVHGTMHVSSNIDLDIVPDTVDEAIEIAVSDLSGLPIVKEPSGPAPGYTTVSSKGVSPSFQDETVPDNDWDWSQLARPPFILSFVDNDHPSGGFVIGWDTCGSCNLHIRTCKCKDGPSQPSYVKRWRSKDDTKHDKPQPISTAGRKAIVHADPDAVAAAVAEVTEDEPVGRKRRADAGVKRGPRKNPNATADSVFEAAGDLASAMTKE